MAKWRSCSFGRLTGVYSTILCIHVLSCIGVWKSSCVVIHKVYIQSANEEFHVFQWKFQHLHVWCLMVNINVCIHVLTKTYLWFSGSNQHNGWPVYSIRPISLWDEFRSGGGGGGWSLLPEYLFPLLARKSSGFARILPDFLPENGYLKNSRGGGGGLQPPLALWPIRLWSDLFEYRRGGRVYPQINIHSTKKISSRLTLLNITREIFNQNCLNLKCNACRIFLRTYGVVIYCPYSPMFWEITEFMKSGARKKGSTFCH